MTMFTSNQLLHRVASCLQELLEVNGLSVRDDRENFSFSFPALFELAAELQFFI
jgi:hypothetical protein